MPSIEESTLSLPTSPTVPHARDDFHPDTKELLAKRAGYICSYPGCHRMTVAASEDRKSGLTLVGVAAHITAAAPGGARYDPLMGHDERSSETNGVWMCQTHSKFIDDTASVCTVSELHRWKRLHEKWVFDRVASGVELVASGLTKLRFQNVGVFREVQEVRLGRHNVLVGPNEAGKTTLCQIAAAFSGGQHWTAFNSRFQFAASALDRSYISATVRSHDRAHTVALSAQPAAWRSASRIHIEIDGHVAADWPRSLFRVLHLDDQLAPSPGLPRSSFMRGIRYLASVFGLEEAVLLDSLREETYATSVLGYRFRRKSQNKVEILVPDGRTFFLASDLLSSSEIALAVVDIALKLIMCSPPQDQWLLVLDSGFYGRLDHKAKATLFGKITSVPDRLIQTLLCLSIEEDAEDLKQAKLDNWVGASQIGKLTLHTFV